jgi:hypothetical protein
MLKKVVHVLYTHFWGIRDFSFRIFEKTINNGSFKTDQGHMLKLMTCGGVHLGFFVESHAKTYDM